MTNVYVPTTSFHDLSKAERFGSLVYLTDGRVDPFKLNELYTQCVMRMLDSHSEDYILMCGHTVLNVVATLAFSHRHSRVQVLMWSAQRQDYEVRRLKFAV